MDLPFSVDTKFNLKKDAFYWPAHYDPVGSRLHGFQQQAKIQEGQHKRAKAQNPRIPFHL